MAEILIYLLYILLRLLAPSHIAVITLRRHKRQWKASKHFASRDLQRRTQFFSGTIIHSIDQLSLIPLCKLSDTQQSKGR